LKTIAANLSHKHHKRQNHSLVGKLGAARLDENFVLSCAYRAL
jgi:hypothetical protein